jgi:hypothetical protein
MQPLWITFDCSPRIIGSVLRLTFVNLHQSGFVRRGLADAGIWPSHNSAFLLLRLACCVAKRKNGATTMMFRGGACVLAGVCLTSIAAAGEYQLPPEVTPAMRSACESDVRRLCIGTNPTVAKVKICVAAKFFQLGKRCQVQIAMAGLKP